MVLLGLLLLLFPAALLGNSISNAFVGAAAPRPRQVPFNLDLAYNQLMMAYSAYCPPSEVAAWDCSFCRNTTTVSKFVVTSIINNATTDTFGYVGYLPLNDRTAIIEVVFRGTQSLQNLIADLDAGHSTAYPYIPGAFVHTGFFHLWNSVKPQVVSAVKATLAKVNATEFYFAGHSLGAALSVLAAVELGVSSGLPVTCYNYGDPRVGNALFAQYFNQHIGTTWRMVNQRDLVPHLPTQIMGFRHIATEVWWRNSTVADYKLCDSSGEDPKCSDSLGITANSIPDHLHYMNVPLDGGNTEHACGDGL